MQNPVILIQAKDMERRNFYMSHLLGKKDMWHDASGSRAVIAYNKNNTKGRLDKVVSRHVSDSKKYQAWSGRYGTDVQVSIIPDPGLGIMLPGDFK